MSRVDISESILRWALDRSNQSAISLKNRFPKIEDWLSGKTSPTIKQIESLSKATKTPFGYFFLKEPPDDRLPIPHYRTLGKDGMQKPSPDLHETIRIMQQRQLWMREYLVEEKHESLSFIGSVTIRTKVETVAGKIRTLLGFKENWASEESTWTEAANVLRQNIESAGIMVVVNGIVGNNTHRKLDPGEFRGFVLVDEYAPLLFINGADSKAAQMFTLGHELAHIFFGSSAAFDLRRLQPANDPTEIACNKVAAEFLVPENALREFWNMIRNTKEPFQSIARQFKVSLLVAARRALDLKLITREMFFDFYNSYQDKDRRSRSNKSSGGDFYANQNLRIGRRFAASIIRAAKEGRILYSNAYQLTGLYGKTFDQYASELEKGGYL